MFTSLPKVIFDAQVIDLAIHQTVEALADKDRGRHAMLLSDQSYRHNIERLVGDVATITMVAKVVEDDDSFEKMMDAISLRSGNRDVLEFTRVLISSSSSNAEGIYVPDDVFKQRMSKIMLKVAA